MSRPKDSDHDESVEPLPDDPRRRAEAEWLLARESDPAAPPPSAEALRDYAELAEMFRTLPIGKQDPSWQDEVFRIALAEEQGQAQSSDKGDELVAGEVVTDADADAAAITTTSPAVAAGALSSIPDVPAAQSATTISAVKTKDQASATQVTSIEWWRRASVRVSVAGTALAAAATIAFVTFSDRSSRQDDSGQLYIAVLEKAATRGDSTYSVGDKLQVGINAQAGIVHELRIFRRDSEGGTLAGMCGGNPCRVVGLGNVSLNITFESGGEYQIIAITRDSQLPLEVSLQEFTAAAEKAATALKKQSLTVR